MESVALTIAKLRLVEWLKHDSVMADHGHSVAARLAAWAFRRSKRNDAACSWLMRLHRQTRLDGTRLDLEAWFREALSSASDRYGLQAFLDRHIETSLTYAFSKQVIENPDRLFPQMMMVLRSPDSRSKGVINLRYSSNYPLVLRLFDMPALLEKYHLVIEPSWAGYCTPDILCFARLREPVFVQTFEPRDADFLASLDANLCPVPLGAHCWVDPRRFRPMADVEKDIDLVMNASWADFKRHHVFFKALALLRRAGRRLRVLLIGYPFQHPMAEIEARARYFGVRDQLEFRDRLKPPEVPAQLNRARVNLLWSRLEGPNKAVIEGMLCNVPAIVREGFNYGYRYPYINEQTGIFSTESSLATDLLGLLDTTDRMTPRDWVCEHMSPMHSAQVLASSITGRSGESSAAPLVAKVNSLNGMFYWDEHDNAHFARDYTFIASLLRASR